MKTKTFLISLITLLFLAGVTGCDDDVCKFDVNDPINDLEWLKNEITTKDTPSYYVRFKLYQNKENSKKYFFLYFFRLAANDRGYGHLAVCGSIRCRGTTK